MPKASASAWLIKRFIDRDARFAWIDGPSDRPRKALGFDFDGAQSTHAANRVTFEVLLASFGLGRDAALLKIGAAVHFLDVGGAARRSDADPGPVLFRLRASF